MAVVPQLGGDTGEDVEEGDAQALEGGELVADEVHRAQGALRAVDGDERCLAWLKCWPWPRDRIKGGEGEASSGGEREPSLKGWYFTNYYQNFSNIGQVAEKRGLLSEPEVSEFLLS